MRVLLLVVLSLPAGVALAGDVFQACANLKTGRLRSAGLATPMCSSREMLVSWNEVGPQGPPGPKGDAGPQGPGLVVKDTNGAVLGVYSYSAYGETAVRQVGGNAVAIRLENLTFQDIVSL